MTFVNHGCNGTANVGVVSQYHEGNLNIPHSLLQKVSGTMTRDSNGGTQSSTIHVYDALRALIPEEYLDDESEDDFYLPIRKPASAIHTETTDQWIYAGSEILDNYLNFGGMLAPDFWENVEMLQRECSGLPGDVQRWEQDEDEDDETNDPTKCENGGCHNEL